MAHEEVRSDKTLDTLSKIAGIVAAVVGVLSLVLGIFSATVQLTVELSNLILRLIELGVLFTAIFSLAWITLRLTSGFFQVVSDLTAVINDLAGKVRGISIVVNNHSTLIGSTTDKSKKVVAGRDAKQTVIDRSPNASIGDKADEKEG